MGIEALHDQIYQHLLEQRTENPDFYFTVRKKGGARLEKGYWFLGNEDYIAVSFWSGGDTKNKTANISFIMMPQQSKFLKKYGCRAFIQLTARDSIKKSKFLQTIATKVPGFIKDCEGQWHKPYTSIDHIKNLDLFLSNDKPVIDGLIGDMNLDGLSLLDESSLKYLEKVKRIRGELYGIRNLALPNQDIDTKTKEGVAKTPISGEVKVVEKKEVKDELQSAVNEKPQIYEKPYFKKRTSLITAGVLKRKINRGLVLWDSDGDLNWTLKQKQYFIDSMLREIDTPKLYLYETECEGENEIVLDGRERISAVVEYYENKFPLGDFGEGMHRDVELTGYYSQLDKENKGILDSYEFSTICLYQTSSDMLEKIRHRLNSHKH
ncbi:MAG: hypothetical protein V7682_02305 [Cycloclasticus sp.]